LSCSSQAQFKAATKRADYLRKKGKQFDFQELLKMEPDGGQRLVLGILGGNTVRFFIYF
jgi:hypothetical protein